MDQAIVEEKNIAFVYVKMPRDNSPSHQHLLRPSYQTTINPFLIIYLMSGISLKRQRRSTAIREIFTTRRLVNTLFRLLFRKPRELLLSGIHRRACRTLYLDTTLIDLLE